MFKQILICLCLLLTTQSTLGSENNIFTTGQVYNITWNCAGPVGILVETHLNNSWIVTENQGCKYLSIIVDSGQQFFLWTIPDSFYKYWKYGNKVSVISLSNNVVLKNTTFNIKNPSFEVTDTERTPSIDYLTSSTLPTKNIDTTSSLNIITEESDNDSKNEICIKDFCLPIYSIVIMCIICLIVLCLCCKCFC